MTFTPIQSMENKEIKYYYLDAEKQTVGPFSKKELEQLHLPKGTKIWYTGLKQWIDYVPTQRRFLFDIKWLFYIGCALLIGLGIFGIIRIASFPNMKHKIIEGAYDCDEFQMYLDKYYRDIEFLGINKRKPRTIIMKLAPMQYFEDTKDIHGLCYGYNNDDIIEIYINEDSWKRMSRPQKYLLMYHELSHDILNVDDLPDKEENYGKLMCPSMLMVDKISMDEFIEMAHALFEEESN